MRFYVFLVQFKAIFSTFKDVKVIQFSTMQDAFPGFSDKVTKQQQTPLIHLTKQSSYQVSLHMKLQFD